MSGNKIRVPDHQRRKAALFGHSQINGFQREKFQELPVGPIEQTHDLDPSQETSPSIENIIPSRSSKITLQGLNLDELRLRKPSGVNRGDLEDMIKPRYHVKKTKERAQPPPKQRPEVDSDKVYADYQITAINIDNPPIIGAPRPYASKIIARKEPQNIQQMEEDIYSALVAPGKKDPPKPVIDDRKFRDRQPDQDSDLEEIPNVFKNKKTNDPYIAFVSQDPTKEYQREQKNVSNMIVPLSQGRTKIFPKLAPTSQLEERQNQEPSVRRLPLQTKENRIQTFRDKSFEEGNYDPSISFPNNKSTTSTRREFQKQIVDPIDDETWQSNFENVSVKNLFSKSKSKEQFNPSIKDEEWIDRPDSNLTWMSKLRSNVQKDKTFLQTENGDSLGNQPMHRVSNLVSKGVEPGDHKNFPSLDRLSELRENKNSRLQYHTVVGHRNINDASVVNGYPLEFLDTQLEKIFIQTKIKNRDPNLAMAPPNKITQRDNIFNPNSTISKKPSDNTSTERFFNAKTGQMEMAEIVNEVGYNGIQPRITDRDSTKMRQHFGEKDLKQENPVSLKDFGVRQNLSTKDRAFNDFRNRTDEDRNNDPRSNLQKVTNGNSDLPFLSNGMFGKDSNVFDVDSNPFTMNKNANFNGHRNMFDQNQVPTNMNKDDVQYNFKVPQFKGENNHKAFLVPQGNGDAEKVDSTVTRKLDLLNQNGKTKGIAISIEDEQDTKSMGTFVKKPAPPKVSVTMKGDKNPEEDFDKQKASDEGNFFERPRNNPKQIRGKPIVEPQTELGRDILSTNPRPKKNLPKAQQKRSVKEKDYVLVFETDTETEKFTPTNSTKKEPKREKRSLSYQAIY